QVAPTTQTQIPAQNAPVAQPQAPAQVAPTTQTQIPAQNAPVAQPQAPAQVAPDAQLQGPTPFVADFAPPTSEALALPAEPLIDANVDAVAPPQTSPLPNNEPRSVAETSVSALAGQDAKNAQTLTACIGRRNPGLFAASTAASSATSGVATGFRPGSISTTAPQIAQSAPTAQKLQTAQNATTAQEQQIAQSAPTAQNLQTAQNATTAQNLQTAQNATVVGPQLPKPFRFDAETAFQRVELLVELENCVAEYFAPLAPIYETAPSPFQAADVQELYAAAPSPSDLAVAEEEEFDENDDFAFASSGSSQTSTTTTPAAAIGGFGSYQAPTFDATPVAPTPQVAQTTQVPVAAQNVYAAPVPQVAQVAQTPGSQYAAPRRSTAEERLQAAIAAGAEVREISPEEYRRAVSVGMSGQTQPR
ncbi:MAG: hypothetical protein J6K20_12675, partial [Thermoguttaceae bacterium]|nr:hypothetical protein [Thermoguttaceae bacterium]